MLEDQQGNLWFGTDYGLSKLGLRPTPIEGSADDKLPAAYTGGHTYLTPLSYGKSDGLKGMLFLPNAVYLDSKNRLWWGTDKGVSMLDMNQQTTALNPPAVSLKYLDINEQFIDYRNIADSLAKELVFSGVRAFENYPLNLELAYDKNHLTFHFSAIDWEAPHKIHYSHRMLGLSDTWSNPTQEAKADYRNLPHGTYTFQIRAIGKSQQWSEPFEYNFTILPPWWQTWWAYVIYALLFLGALRIFSLWRERRLRQEKELLQMKVEERTGELKQSLEDLKSTQAQLIQSEKMASLGELTAGIAHEIQNPLNFVNNFSELNRELIAELKEEVEKGDLEEVKLVANDIETNEEKINHHGKRAAEIVKSMLQHSRTGTGEKEPTDINQLAAEYLRLSYHGLRAKDKSFNADFKFEADQNLPKVNVVPQDIGRVLLNLINNAFQASTERSERTGSDQYVSTELENKYPTHVERSGEGTKNVTLRAPQRDSPLVIVSTKAIPPSKGGQGDFDTIQITVSDNGPGIPDDIKDKIFQPFFTTKPTGQGTGLGLSLSYDIVKAHGGELKVELREEEGSKFIIQLPIV